MPSKETSITVFCVVERTRPLAHYSAGNSCLGSAVVHVMGLCLCRVRLLLVFHYECWWVPLSLHAHLWEAGLSFTTSVCRAAYQYRQGRAGGSLRGVVCVLSACRRFCNRSGTGRFVFMKDEHLCGLLGVSRIRSADHFLGWFLVCFVVDLVCGL